MLSFKEMQMLVEADYSIEDTREDLNRIVEFFRSQPYHEQYVDIAFVQARKLPKWIADEQKIFFVDEDILISEIPEEFHAEALGIIKKGKSVYSGRLVYPVMDVKGNVMGFCGWDKFDEPKYLDSRNHGYKAKATTFYGMEKLSQYYKSDKPVYVVEGIVCCLYLRSIGLQAIAILGSNLTPYVIQILRRFGSRLIVIPDNDVIGKQIDLLDSLPAGEHLVKLVKKQLSLAIIIQSIIDKDVDDTRQHEDKEELFKHELLAVAINPYQSYTTIRVR